MEKINSCLHLNCKSKVLNALIPSIYTVNICKQVLATVNKTLAVLADVYVEVEVYKRKKEKTTSSPLFFS